MQDDVEVMAIGKEFTNGLVWGYYRMVIFHLYEGGVRKEVLWEGYRKPPMVFPSWFGQGGVGRSLKNR